jgi:hypothetical protein
MTMTHLHIACIGRNKKKRPITNGQTVFKVMPIFSQTTFSGPIGIASFDLTCSIFASVYDDDDDDVL